MNSSNLKGMWEEHVRGKVRQVQALCWAFNELVTKRGNEAVATIGDANIS
jgi:hypothetical protein